MKLLLCLTDVCDDLHVLSSSCAEEPKKKDEMMQKFQDFLTKAETYYMYHTIYRHVVRETCTIHTTFRKQPGVCDRLSYPVEYHRLTCGKQNSLRPAESSRMFLAVLRCSVKQHLQTCHEQPLYSSHSLQARGSLHEVFGALVSKS